MGERAISSRAPTRIDFAGGWSDVAEFAHDPPGAVVNAAITLHSYASVRPRPAGDRRVTITSLDYGERVEAESASALVYDGTLDLLKGAVRALDPGVGLDVRTRAAAPPGSGLGTSAAMGVALLAALNRLGRRGLLEHELAELASRIEREELHIRGGKQDQYASATGGVSYLTFEGHRVTHYALRLDEDLVREMHRRMVLCYTGTSRLSGAIHQHVAEAVARGEPGTVRAMAELKRIAAAMRRALLSGDLAGFGRLLSENWENQKRLHPSVTNAEVEGLFAAAAAQGAPGGKACGAGGGGCLVFLAPADREHDLRTALAAQGAGILEFEFDFEGVQTWAGLSGA
jgi:D-glycero-alpha-D-manno-heptose-7-phosphate kinase